MARHRYRTSAPLGLQVLAALTALDGLSTIGVAAGAFALNPIVGLLIGSLGLAQILTGYGLWKREPLAYSSAMALFALSAIVDLATGQVYGAGLSVINAYVLYHYRGLFRS